MESYRICPFVTILSLSIMSSRVIHVVAGVSISFRSSVDGHQLLFCLSALVADVAATTGADLCPGPLAQSFGCAPRWGSLDLRAIPYLIFEELPYCFPIH